LADFAALSINASINTTSTYTNIPPTGTTATGNPTGGGGSTSIRLDSPAYTRRDTGGGEYRTSLRAGLDLIVLTRSGGKREVYRVGSISTSNNTDLLLDRLQGSTGFTADESLTDVQWVQPTFLTMAGEVDGGEVGFFSLPYMNGSNDTALKRIPFFAASSLYRSDSIPNPLKQNFALQWGAFNEKTGERDWRGTLLGDGDILVKEVQCTGFRTLCDVRFRASAGTTSWTWDPQVRPSGSLDWDATPGTASIRFNVTAAAGDAVTLEVKLDDSVCYPEDGDHITVIVRSTLGADITMQWTALVGGFRFSGSDSALPPGVVGSFKWEGVYDATDEKFLMTRTDYL
jgi:hypothetical protein